MHPANVSIQKPSFSHIGAVCPPLVKEIECSSVGRSAPETHPAGTPQPTPSFGPAPLPDPQGTQASPQNIRAAVQCLLPENEQDASAYTAYWIMQRIAAMSQATQSELMRQAQNTANQARKQEAHHTLDQVFGQNKSTVVNAVGMGGASLLTAVMGLGGFLGGMPSFGQFATQLTQIATPFIGVLDRHSERFGGAYHSNLASLALKDDGINSQSGNNAVEAARAGKETAQERMRFAAEFLSGHLQRKFDSINSMLR